MMKDKGMEKAKLHLEMLESMLEEMGMSIEEFKAKVQGEGEEMEDEGEEYAKDEMEMEPEAPKKAKIALLVAKMKGKLGKKEE